MIDCHYRRLSAEGEFQVFESTDGTRSNWDPEIQHGSPPLALMTKLIEEQAGDSGLRVGRLTLDILGAIPVTRLRVRSWVERPGARISMMAAEMLSPRPDGSERAVARVTAWLLATSDTADAATDRHPPLVEGDSIAVPHSWVDAKGYLETVSWRTQRVAEGEPSVAWLSPLVPLVDAEPTTAQLQASQTIDHDRNDVMRRWDEFKQKDLPAMNRLLRQAHIPEINPQAAIQQVEPPGDEE